MTRRKITATTLLTLLCVLLSGFYGAVAKAQCTNCGNAYLNVTDISSIEYDNMISLFHSTMTKQASGKVLVWGERTKSNGSGSNLVPAELNSANYSGLTGDILKIAAGSNSQNNAQFAVLTTTGLFIWGDEGILVSSSFKSGTNFAKVNSGLPAGVNPTDVKMLFGTYQTLALLTCSGNVWVLSQNSDMRGAGNNASSSTTWYQVTESGSGNPVLSNVVAVRGAPGGLMAQKSDGTVWTWGREVYLGNAGDYNNRNRATKMTLTYSGNTFTPKMIGMTGTTGRSSHYILGTDGYIYSLGDNSYRQLGDRSTSERKSWVRVKSGNSTDLGNIAWISPNEHDNYGVSAVNAITQNGVVWAWGSNERNMLGLGDASSNYNPTTPPGGLTGSDLIVAVETGGHTSMVVKKCSGRYGYVGHRVHGSMADGSDANENETTYNFSATAVMDICGASSGATTLFPPQGTVHIGDQIQLDYAPAGGTFTVTGPATITQTGLLTITGKNTGIKVTYTASGDCGTTSSEITIKAEDIFLPATFDKVSASIRGNQLLVSFTTLTEQNNSHFEIEASKDGKTFVKIGALKSTAINGSSNMPINYNFDMSQSAATGLLGMSVAVLAFAALLVNRRNKWMLMVAVMLGTGIFGATSCKKQEATPIDNNTKLFIRIKQVDKDGGYSYSKVIQAVQE
ncbi:hypothetical protein LL912_17995 [Niabella sp. CC-SYL272]|uniref:hypothetical protein n=1 Tax=Niabella agricola TaxID=2891571 RepID=UPI001F20211E|nr:hypothetical protein [Niabella agricola]MCF3110680.1 hypothetical protein [Niabella agricola]